MAHLPPENARGDWVEDVYREGHAIHEYKSDFDILVVTEDKKTTQNDFTGQTK